ncbi:acyl carrier protein 1, chloroplastic-like [Abrus precatorius]|uniref:Acyl carrier protein n=1 Tax=Abrus precatorius TaxID=3816 RepID=A0A8B8LIP3_ABRPR|nr:acyl carrier protein 1, chloroplastic-like [Abrus precatorius]
MAFSSATSLSFESSRICLTIPSRISSLRTVTLTVGWTRRSFPSLKTRISCAVQAQPETVQKVCEIVRKRLALPLQSELTPQIKFSALGADSLDTVEIVTSLEEEFGISVDDENSELITTVQEAAELIDKLVQKKDGD